MWYRWGMTTFKTPKQKTHSVRIPESLFPHIQELRAALKRAVITTSGGGTMRLNPEVPLRDSVVLIHAVSMANLMMTGDVALINRRKFLEALDREVVRRMGDFAERTEDERRAMLDLIFEGCCEFAPFDLSSPLRAATPEGGQPS